MFRLTSFTGGFTQTNGFLLSADSGANVLVDAPEGVADWLTGQDISVDVLLLTHMHFDHVVDAGKVIDRERCEVMAFAPEPSEDLTMAELVQSMGMEIEIAPFKVDRVLEGEGSCEAEGLEFDLLHIPGHSPDSICFCPRPATSEGQRIVLGGDVLFRRSIGRTDFPHSDHEQLITGIREKLFALSDETIVFPGHGPWTTIGEEKAENPFLI